MQNFAIQIQDYEFYVADVSAPLLVDRAPAVGATGVAATTTLVLEFNENVSVSSSGSVTLTPQSNPGGAILVTPSTGGTITASGHVVTVTIGGGLLPNQTVETYLVTVSSGLITDVAGNAFAGIATGYWFRLADTLAPTITTFTPANATATVNATTAIVLAFNEEVVAGSGNIVFRSAVAVYTVAVTDTTQVTVVGSSVQITLSGAGFSDGLTYQTEIGSGVIVDTSGNSFAGLNGTDFVFTVADRTAPVEVWRSPPTGAFHVPLMPTFWLRFSEAVHAGQGNISFVPATTGPTLTMSVTDTSFVTFFGNSSMRFQPSAMLTSAVRGQDYAVVVDTGAVQDLSGNAFTGIPMGAWIVSVVDASAPELVSVQPRNESTRVPANNDLILRFNEPMAVGTGNIVLSSLSNASQSLTIPVGGSEVFVLGTVVVIDPVQDLSAGRFTLLMQSGVLTDNSSSANPFAGLSGGEFWFEVADTRAPSVAAYEPAQDATNVLANTSIVLTFDEAVMAGIGFITITPEGGVGPTVEINVSDTARVWFNGSVVTVDPSSDLVPGPTGQGYRVEMEQGVITDTEGNAFTGLYVAMYRFSLLDVSAPLLVDRAPASGAVDVAATTMIVLEFNENVSVSSSGSVTLTPQSNPGGAIVVTPSTGGTITASGHVVTVTIGGGLLPNQTVETYLVIVSSGLIADVAGNAFAGIATGYSFSLADTVAPLLASTVPVNGGTVGASVTFAFNEPIQLARGTIEFVCGLNTINVSTFDATQVSLSSTQDAVIVTPAGGFPSGPDGCTYSVQTGATPVVDLRGNAWVGIGAGELSVRVPDSVAPAIVNHTATVMYSVGLEILFSESIVAGSGSVVLNSSEPSCPTVTIPTNGTTQVNISGRTVTLLPPLSGWCGNATGAVYSVWVPSGSFRDPTSNPVAETVFSVTVPDTVGPTLVSPPVTADILRTSTFDLTFSENVVRGSGVLHFSLASQPTTSVVNVSVNDSRVRIVGNVVSIDTGGNPRMLPLTGNARDTYTVEVPSGALTDGNANNNTAGTATVSVANSFVNASITPSVLYRGANTTLFVTFATMLGIRDFDYIVVTLPTGFGVPSGDLQSLVTVISTGFASTDVRGVGQQVMIQKVGGLAIQPGDTVMLEIRGVVLPSTVGQTAQYTLHIANSRSVMYDLVNVAGSNISSSSAPVFDHSATVVSAASGAGALTSLNFSFVTQFAIRDFDSIIVTFPGVTAGSDGFDFPTGILNDVFTPISPSGAFFVYGDLASRMIVAQKLVGGGPINASQTVVFSVANIRLPNVLGMTGTFNFYLRRLDGTVVDSFSTVAGINVTESAPPVFTQSVYSASFTETAIYTSVLAPPFAPVLVTTVTATHGSGAVITNYSIVSGNDIDLFAITSSGQIVTTQYIDYETATVVDFNLTVRAVYVGPPPMDAYTTVLITLLDANDHSPTFVFPDPTKTFYDVTVHESTSVGTAVAIVTATDADSGPNGDVTLSFNGGDFGKFALDMSTGAVSVASALSRAEQAYFGIVVRATDEPVDPSTRRFVETVVSVNVLSDDVVAYTIVTVASVSAFNTTEFETAVTDAICPFGECSLHVLSASQDTSRRRREVDLRVQVYVVDTAAFTAGANASTPMQRTYYSSDQIVALLQDPDALSRLSASNASFVLGAASVSGGAGTTVAPGSSSSNKGDYGGLTLAGVILIPVAIVFIVLLILVCVQCRYDVGLRFASFSSSIACFCAWTHT